MKRITLNLILRKEKNTLTKFLNLKIKTLTFLFPAKLFIVFRNMKRKRTTAGMTGRPSRPFKKPRYTPRPATPAAIPRRLRGYVRSGGTYGRYLDKGGNSPEKKWINVNQTAVVCAATGTYAPATATAFYSADSSGIANGVATNTLCSVSMGNQPSQRIGIKVVITQINMRIHFEIVNSVEDRLRFMLILDKQANGAVFASTDVLAVINTAAAASAISVDSFNNLDNSHRFLTLMDKQFDVNTATSNGVIAANNNSFMIKKTIKCAIPIEWQSGTTTTLANQLKSNNIACLMFSSTGTALCNFVARLRFTDS